MKPLLLSLIATLPVLHAESTDIVGKDGTVTVRHNGEVFTEYRTDSRVPYLYPLLSASGACLSRHWPMSDDYKEEERDHPHHRSLWLSHGAVNGHDFWAWTTKASDPRIVHKGIRATNSTANGGSFTVDLAWTAGGKTHLTEERTFTFRWPDKETSIIGVVSKLTAADGDVLFGDTKEGTFAVRVDRTLRLKGQQAKGHIADSEGRSDFESWGKRSNWVAFTGPDEKGEPAVVAMFDHPTNLRNPTWWHARDYGLLAANPFGIHDFEGKKDKHLGDYTLKKGETLTLRYEVVLHHGSLESAKLPGLWTEFAK
ncbi:PmoA family protein [Luteolibacter marinus]|uniref:DUF6807 domain-containing protein n=1 Tax=Luteolibacter marinus TaxID=2776705 RepID=UPI0018679C89|nr:PmoA family protein [Luteolibacter marinus]